MFVFEAGKIIIINCVLLKGIQRCLTPNRAHVIDKKNKEIMRWYQRKVRYSTYDICWPNPSIWISRRKDWACATCKHPKIAFCVLVISNFTSISWTLLLKKALAKICSTLGGRVSLLVKLLNSKSGIVSRRKEYDS